MTAGGCLLKRRKGMKQFFLFAGSYLFLLVLSYGFPVAGDDWFFTTRYQNEGIWDAIQRGIAISRVHFFSTNGRYLGNAFSAIFGCSDLWREVFRCGIVLGILLLLCRFCGIRRGVPYVAMLALLVALPARIFSESYAWAAGFFNYVPPALLMLAYFLAIDPLADREYRDHGYQFPLLLLLGLCTQFFAEHVTVAVCLLSVLLWIGYLAYARRCSWKLTGYTLGALAGAVLMFCAPGYRNIGEEGYRTISQSASDLMAVVQGNFLKITGCLTEDNWGVIGLLSAACIALLGRGVKQCRGRSQKLRILTLLLVTVPLVFFYANQHILDAFQYKPAMSQLTFALDVICNLAYLWGLVQTVFLCINSPQAKRRALLLLLAAVLVLAPLLVVTPIGPRCLYVPDVFLIGLFFILAGEVVRAGHMEKSALRWPVLAVACSVLLCYLWMMVWNGHAETVRVRYTEEKLSQMATEITLPSYPYSAYIHGGDSGTIHQYYFHAVPGDVTFYFVPYEVWSWE